MILGKIIEGEVVHGEKLGRKLGFPTANIRIDALTEDQFGVFFAKIEIENQNFYGVLSLGKKATVQQDATPLAECFIFDFTGDIYGAHITITILEYLRDQQKFNNIEELKQQITSDVQRARQLLLTLGDF